MSCWQLLIPLERFLSPDETNLDLVQLYVQAVFSSTVTSHRTPVMYLVAVHHINRFIYLQTDVQQLPLRRWVIRQIFRLHDEVSEATWLLQGSHASWKVLDFFS